MSLPCKRPLSSPEEVLEFTVRVRVAMAVSFCTISALRGLVVG